MYIVPSDISQKSRIFKLICKTFVGSERPDGKAEAALTITGDNENSIQGSLMEHPDALLFC